MKATNPTFEPLAYSIREACRLSSLGRTRLYQLGTSIYRSPNGLLDDSLARDIWSGRCGSRGYSDYRIT